MIDRYTLPEMGALWSEQNKFQKWRDVFESNDAVCPYNSRHTADAFGNDRIAFVRHRARSFLAL